MDYPGALNQAHSGVVSVTGLGLSIYRTAHLPTFVTPRLFRLHL